MNPGWYVFHGHLDSFLCLVAETDGVLMGHWLKGPFQYKSQPIVQMQEFGIFAEVEIDIPNLNVSLGRRM